MEEKKMIDIALHHTNKKYRIAALSYISDPDVLTQIALHDRAGDVRKAAVSEIKDANVLLHIALHDPVKKVRFAAVERLKDKSIEINDAKTMLSGIPFYKDQEGYVRSAIVSRLDDQEMLTEIALHNRNWRIRCAASSELNDKDILKHTAHNDDEEVVRQAASKKMYELERRIANNKNMPIYEFDLSVREYNILHRSGISTVGDLTNLTIEEFSRFPQLNMSEKTEIRENLNKLGLDFSEEQ